MAFYADPAFFILVALAAVPAVVLGLLEKPLKRYGLGVSVVFLALLFSGTPDQLLSFAVFFAVSIGAMLLVNRWFSSGASHAVLYYRLALAAVIIPVASAKVGDLFDENLLGFLGISYLTFKSVQVLIEIRDGLIKDPSLFDLVYFLLFFPVFTSGPIMRSRDFCSQIDEPLSRSAYGALLSQGLLWMLKGVMYTFVLASFTSWLMWFVPSALGDETALAAVGSTVGYTSAYGLNLFFDFAGYSFMAMGVGSCLGIAVPTNFRAPFRSIDIKDFWDRWHITLSFWLRDYVFMRVTKGLLRKKLFKSRLTTACVAFMTTFTLMGLWHGLTVDYVAYGLYHGCLLSLCEIHQKKSKFYKAHKKDRWYRIGSWAVTMVAIFFGFAIFNGQVFSALLGA